MTLASALLVLTTLGCRLGEPAPGAGGLPPELELASLPGLSTISLKLAARLGEAPMPDYASVLVTVVSASMLPKGKTVVLKAEEAKAREADGKPIFEILPPARDAVVRAYLRGPDETLIAGGEVRLALGRRGNTVTVPLTARVQAPRPLRASDGVKVDDHVIIKGIAVDMATGLPDGMPGIERVAIDIHGPAYAEGKEVAELAVFAAPKLAEYTWRPANESRQFDPARLGAGSDSLPFTLTSKAFDGLGNLVGKTRLDLTIVGTAFVDVGFDP